MDRIIVLVVILSLHSSCCLGLGEPSADPQIFYPVPTTTPYNIYDTPRITTQRSYTYTPPNGLYTQPPPPDICEAGKEINFNFTKVLVTQTTRLPPVTDTITLPAEMVHISVPSVLETLTIFETQTQDPVTIPVDIPGVCRPTRPVHTSLTTLELATTVTADPIIEIKPWKEIEWETVPPVTATVTVTTTLPKETDLHMVMRHFTNTVVRPTVTFMSTISVTITEMLPAIIKTKRLGYTKTERVSPVTERHAPVTMMQPPQVKIYRIDITQTSIPPAVSKMVMYTTTVEEAKPCGYYSKGVPTKAFSHGHGRGQTQAISFDLPS